MIHKRLVLVFVAVFFCLAAQALAVEYRSTLSADPLAATTAAAVLVQQENNNNKTATPSKTVNGVQQHAIDLQGAQFWLDKLEQRLLADKARIKSTLKDKRDAFVGLRNKTRDLKVQYETEKQRHERNKVLLESSKLRYKDAQQALQLAESDLARLKNLYLIQVNHTRCAKEGYLYTIQRLRIKELKAELQLIQLMKTKILWLERLVEKWVKIKTIHIHHYHYYEKDPLQDGSCLCPVMLRPVCGYDGITYSSECVAKCARVKVFHAGHCECKPTPPAPKQLKEGEKKEEEAAQVPPVSRG